MKKPDNPTKLRDMSKPYLIHLVGVADQELGDYRAIGTVEQIRAVIEAMKRVAPHLKDSWGGVDLTVALNALEGGKK